eukprot:gene30137-36406_t
MDEKLASLLSAANVVADVQLAKVVSSTLSFLLQPAKDEYTNELAEIAGECSNISGPQFRQLSQGLIILLQSLLENGADSNNLKERCVSLGLTASAITTISSCWNAWAGKIATHLVSKVIAQNKLVDLDWTFGVTASSDDCDHVGKTYLQLKLTLEQDNGKKRPVFMELTLDQFYQFLASLEKCRSFLDYVSPRKLRHFAGGVDNILQPAFEMLNEAVLAKGVATPDWYLSEAEKIREG